MLRSTSGIYQKISVKETCTALCNEQFPRHQETLKCQLKHAVKLVTVYKSESCAHKYVARIVAAASLVNFGVVKRVEENENLKNSAYAIVSGGELNFAPLVR